LPNGYIMMEHQPSAITVTAADVACGVIDIRGGSRFVVVTSAPSHYAVRIFNSGTQFGSVHLEGLRQAIVLAANEEQTLLEQVAAGRREIVLDYRFTIARDTRPGTYAWPVTLAVSSTVQGSSSSSGP
jgi:hypothetical protein